MYLYPCLIFKLDQRPLRGHAGFSLNLLTPLASSRCSLGICERERWKEEVEGEIRKGEMGVWKEKVEGRNQTYIRHFPSFLLFYYSGPSSVSYYHVLLVGITGTHQYPRSLLQGHTVRKHFPVAPQNWVLDNEMGAKLMCVTSMSGPQMPPWHDPHTLPLAKQRCLWGLVAGRSHKVEGTWVPKRLYGAEPRPAHAACNVSENYNLTAESH